VGTEKIKRKKMKHSSNLKEFLGDHEGLGKYDDKYGVRNMNEIRHVLATNSNSASKFEIGLRTYPTITKGIGRTKSVDKV
jgi:hypothetical protein